MNGLIAGLMGVQVALPLLLIVLNALLPGGSLPGALLRAGALALGLVYLALAGLWLFPPWWTPWLLLALHAAGTAWALSRLPRRRPWPGWARPVEIVGGSGAAIAMGVLLVPVLQARATPEGAVELTAPLRPGSYLVMSGGTAPAINTHMTTLSAERFRPFRGQSHAVDLIAVDAFGLRAAGIAPTDPRAYRIYGMEVLAPCAGRVLATVDGLPDQLVPEVDRDNLAGNHVLLGCGDVAVLLAHFASGSVRVGAGDEVAVGEVLGLAGNSGNSSEPHLHIHVQRGVPADASLSGEPVWFTIGGRFLVRNDVVSFAPGE